MRTQGVQFAREPIHVISLGAGVQSSVMALMAAHGEITPMPQAAIFADTQAEPRSVYQWLEWLIPQLPFPVHVITHKNGLVKETLRLRERQDGQGYWALSGIPGFTVNHNGSHGQIQRQCTSAFKIRPLHIKALQIMREVGAKRVVQWIGISLDEVSRMKSARLKSIENRWPLIEARKTRHDCLRWMERHGYPKPPRSACVFCPYHSNYEWRRLRDEEPESFAQAVQFEKDFNAIKRATNLRAGSIFLHSSRVPLDQVEFSSDEERGQMSLFNNECEGMCGV